MATVAVAEMDRRQAGARTVVLGALGLGLFMFGSARGADGAAMAGLQANLAQVAGPVAMAGACLLMLVGVFARG